MSRVRETPPRISSRRHPWNNRYSYNTLMEDGPCSSSISSSSRGASDSSIFKGAQILKAQLQQQQERSSNAQILRGAAAVKAQLLSRHRAASPFTEASDDFSDPWEKKSTATSMASGSRQEEESPQSEASSGFGSSFGTPTEKDDSRMFPDHSYESFGEENEREDSRLFPEQTYEGSFDEEEAKTPVYSPRLRKFEQEAPFVTPSPSHGSSPSSYRKDDMDPHLSSDDEEDAEWHEEQVKKEFDGEWHEEVVSREEPHDDLFPAKTSTRRPFDDGSFPVVMREEVPEWTDSSATASTEPPPPPPSRDPEEVPPPPPPNDDTPVTLMGRGNSLKLKIVTYNVERTDDIDVTDSDTISTDADMNDDLVYSFSPEDRDIDRLGIEQRVVQSPESRKLSFPENTEYEEANEVNVSKSSSSYLPGKYSPGLSISPHAYDGDDDNSASYIPQSLQPRRLSSTSSLIDSPTSTASSFSSSPLKGVLPMSMSFTKLMRDPAYRHAQRAGLLWQTLVAQHVRFPGHWWDGDRSPQMGMMDDFFGNGKSHCYWRYISRDRVYSDPRLKRRCRNRASPGRVLLHIVVRDLMTHLPVQDIAVGVFHPNARGVRRMEKPDPREEDCREVWLAVRKRESDGAVSAVDRFLTKGRSIDDLGQDSPLGGKPRISNQNMRAVFGERPPVQTIFMLESELYERMTVAEEEKGSNSADTPALLLLEEFLSGP